MKASNYILPTTKDDPADAVVASHKLMIRAGLVRKSGSGLYHFLPMGLRVLKKIEQIIREEMDLTGALEFELPILSPSEFWKESGRWEKMGKEMFRIKDRHDNEYSLGPTHEESFSALMKPILKSYKDLPKNVYQIHTKFRDEVRPRFGVIRSREFIMKDAYSFHLDDASLNDTYQAMRKAYRRIFKRCGLETIPVQADSGTMGGSGSEEFMVVSHIGEETLALCKSCEYSGNVEKTPLIIKNELNSSTGELEKVHTPSTKTIEDVARLLGISEKETIKSVILKADNTKNIVVFIRGDREVNEVKLKNHLAALDLRPLSDNECKSLNLVPGFCGPGILNEQHKDLEIIFDSSIQLESSYVVGGNELNFHLKNFIIKKELKSEIIQKDLALVRDGDLCPNCGKEIHTEKGIEVGHIFKLGDKYTKAFDIKVTDKSGKSVLATMGCYGIGINRTMATVIEQSHDDKGIIWPLSIAPYEVSLVSITKTEEEMKKAEEIYEFLYDKGLEIFWDDRDLSPGFKLRDSEMIGFPIRITLGKNFWEKNEFSILNRKTMEEKNIPFKNGESIYSEIVRILQGLYKEVIPV